MRFAPVKINIKKIRITAPLNPHEEFKNQRVARMKCSGMRGIFNFAPNPLKGAKDKSLIFKVPFKGFRGFS
jgi:hypothetical protein